MTVMAAIIACSDREAYYLVYAQVINYKNRLDKLLVERGHCRSRNQAQELISLGKVEVKTDKQWIVASKASTLLDPEVLLRISSHSLQNYVSRAALKLLGAFEKHPVNITGLRALDIGQSTGGFTQVLLEKGAAEVVGIEVGHGQLAQSLRKDQRVCCLEGINARELSAALSRLEMPQTMDPAVIRKFDFAVMDVSFISQTLVVPELRKVLHSEASLLSLVKPQFEAGPNGITKGGIVRDIHVLTNVRKKIMKTYEDNNFKILDYFPSSVKGSDGNSEFFVYASAND
jgi:23S rRNA (cytidine1920-2'-O)/16S rRNA (cytidine1409-2'-O)-methyltransferase